MIGDSLDIDLPRLIMIPIFFRGFRGVVPKILNTRLYIVNNNDFTITQPTLAKSSMPPPYNDGKDNGGDYW